MNVLIPILVTLVLIGAAVLAIAGAAITVVFLLVIAGTISDVVRGWVNSRRASRGGAAVKRCHLNDGVLR